MTLPIPVIIGAIVLIVLLGFTTLLTLFAWAGANLEIQAIRAVAKIIRDQAFEERLVAARVAAGGGIAAERPKS